MVGRVVSDDGTGREPLVIIGEAPGFHEDKEGRPFVGPAGYRIRDWMSAVGLERQDAYWTNVYERRPPGNAIGTIARAEIEASVERLHERLARLVDPIVIVPTGNVALRALTGKGYFPWEGKKRPGGVTIPGIMNHRGSVYSYTDLNGRVIKVIPTLHPAMTFRQTTMEKRCRIDWKRIAGDLEFRELRLPVREHVINPTLNDLYWFRDSGQWLTRESVVTIDLEWVPPRKDGGRCQVLCVGLAVGPDLSLTVPTTMAYWRSKVDLWEAWCWIKSVVEGPNEKVLQHGHSDAYVLKRLHKITICNRRWDTLAMHHTIDANDDHDLAYLASIYTRQPYWKAEAKDPEEIRKYATNFEALLTYNGIDCCVTHELFGVFLEMLEDERRV